MTCDTLAVSLNEIGFFVTRGAVGVGAPFGIAEDFAEAIKWVTRLGIDPMPATLSSLNLLDCRPDRSRIAVAEEGTDLMFYGQDGLSALFAGPALADFGQLRRDGKSALKARNVDHPLLVAAVLASTPISACVLEWPGARVSFAVGDNADLEAIDRETLEDAGPVDVVLMDSYLREPTDWSVGYRLHAADLKIEACKIAQEGVMVDTVSWTGLINLFQRCLVPSSERSLVAGAGAGLVDTD